MKNESKDKKRKRIIAAVKKTLAAVFVVLVVYALIKTGVVGKIISRISEEKATDISELTETVGELPPFDGNAYFTINGNKASFDDELLEKASGGSFEEYGKLDSSGRCTGATACLSKDTMPAEGEARGDISSIHPSGWRSGMGWERCHLIAWSLSAENANECNLITGTHYLNVTGMQTFEEKVFKYINRTGNHVLYQVTPIYDGRNHVASGVHMMAYSVEDKGREINYNVYCYNVEPGYEIDYATGAVYELDNAGSKVRHEARDYVLNTNSHKFHYPSCKGAKDIAGHNRKEVNAVREDLIEQGYEPCGMCEP